MQDTNQLDISTITDLDKLRELYVTSNETLMQAQHQVQVSTNNLQLVRQKMLELQQISKEEDDYEEGPTLTSGM